MPKVYSFEGIIPVIHPDSFVHPDAVIIGDVVLGAGCYIGPCASLRGDFGPIRIEEGSNIQDSCVLHSFPEVTLTLGGNCHVGHGAVLHGCTLGKNVLIGMNAVVMDRAVIGENAFVGACGFVKAGMAVPPGTLAAGVPAVVVRELTSDELIRKSQGTKLYRELAIRSNATLIPTKPLTHR